MALPVETVKTSVYIPKDHLERINRLAEVDGVAPSQAIRDAIKFHLINRGY
ncbi:CopG family transcriptional regulator [Leptolyngbya sp. FACHB-17]|nr:CopG family transcriptional regulator [Leptolyngbya sp. FACHB-17]